MRPEHGTLKRYKAWVDHYLPLLGELHADKLFLIDDGGDDCSEFIHVVEDELPETLLPVINLYRFRDNMGRKSVVQFPGWWRSFLFAIEIARKYGYRKMVHIESDFFVLSPRLRKFIRTTDHGWTGLYSNFYKFPETCLQVIGEDAFDRFLELRQTLEERRYHADTYAELILPFTRVTREFIGDRFCEPGVLADWIIHRPGKLSRLDYMAQVEIR